MAKRYLMGSIFTQINRISNSDWFLYLEYPLRVSWYRCGFWKLLWIRTIHYESRWF